MVFPKELLTRMKVKEGDALHAIETRHGILRTPYDAAVEEQIACGERFMDRYRETFRKLAE